MDSSKRIALVTGSSHGIGLEVIKQLAEGGMSVYLSARNEDKAQEAASGFDSDLDVMFLQLDVTDEKSLQAAVKKVEAEHGKLDVLVNNAAAFADWSETPSSADLNHSRDVMNVNLFGPWRVTQAFLPLLKKSGNARIVNVSSGAGSHGEQQFGLTSSPTTASYAVSKAALNALTVKFASELKGDGILVNSVDPGLTATAPGMEEMGAQPVPEGAKSVVWAAVLDKNGPTGGFYRHGKSLPW